MWWSKKKENKQDLIKKIISDFVNEEDLSVNGLTTKLMNEAKLEYELASEVSEAFLNEFLEINYKKRTELIKEEFSELYNLPFSEFNRLLVMQEVEKFALNKISVDEFINHVDALKQKESDIWLQDGQQAINLGQMVLGLQRLDTSLVFSSDNYDALLLRAMTLQKMSFHEEAVQDFSLLIEINPFDLNLRYLRGCSNLQLCDFDNARSDLSVYSSVDHFMNEQQKEFAREQGFDSVSSMYQSTYDLLSTMEKFPTELITKIRSKNLHRKKMG